MTREPKLVIFDLDGTLVDSSLDLTTAVNWALVDPPRRNLECERCGEPIADARLEIMPTAVLCIDCAETSS